jgi:hypothetical protein
MVKNAQSFLHAVKYALGDFKELEASAESVQRKQEQKNAVQSWNIVDERDILTNCVIIGENVSGNFLSTFRV